ncbi:MAG: hypothetical protein L0Y79_02100 [Chlorobi bacterium]|nr:hypothetical protein [Chlorobiota bacterium]MCI0716294.1 hypothetical protein [Chlorobiota bacterium]
MGKREQNERKFENWVEIEDNQRKYWYDVFSKSGWKARYAKIVNKDEETLKFYQEIYNENGELIEIHEKYPVDKGHKKIL